MKATEEAPRGRGGRDRRPLRNSAPPQFASLIAAHFSQIGVSGASGGKCSCIFICPLVCVSPAHHPVLAHLQVPVPLPSTVNI